VANKVANNMPERFIVGVMRPVARRHGEQMADFLEAAYPRLFDTVKGRSGGDPFVIALARIKCPPLTLVTEESPGKQSAKPSITARRNLSC
jgi:hypothetical protein